MGRGRGREGRGGSLRRHPGDLTVLTCGGEKNQKQGTEKVNEREEGRRAREGGREGILACNYRWLVLPGTTDINKKEATMRFFSRSTAALLYRRPPGALEQEPRDAGHVCVSATGRSHVLFL